MASIPRVIDLTGRVKTRKQSSPVVRSAVRELFDDLKGMCVDNDGTMAHGNSVPIERQHEQFWRGALVAIAQNALRDRVHPEQLSAKVKEVSDALDQHLHVCFQRGGQLIGGAFDILKERHALPRGIRDADKLDELASTHRVPLIRDAIQMGHIRLMTDTVPLFLHLRRQRNIRIGMYTLSDRQTGATICEELFGRQLFDELIKEEAHTEKKRRLYGSDIPRGKRKPHSYGWGVLAKNMGLQPEDCGIMEDRLNVIMNALSDFPFRFGILVMAPENHHHPDEFEQQLAETRRQLSGWHGAPILLVRNVARLRVLLEVPS